MNHVSTKARRVLRRRDIPQVADGTGVTKHLSTNRHVSATVRNIDRSRLPGTGSPSNSPSCSSSNEDDCDTESVLQPGSGALSLLKNVAEAVATLSTASGTSATGSTTASSATRQTKVVLLIGNQRGALVDDSVLGSGDGALAFATGIQGVVVEALRQEDGVGEAEVDGESDDGRHEISPKSTSEVGDVSCHPYQQESDGNAVRGRLTVVLDQLRHLEKLSQVQVRAYATKSTKGFFYQQEDPASQRDAPGDAREGLVHRQSDMFQHCARSELGKQRRWFSMSQSSYVIAAIGFCGMLTFASEGRWPV